MRSAVLLALLLSSGCLTQCGAIGGGAIGHGSIGSGAIGGTATAPADDGCGSPPGTPSLHYAARLETEYANTDVVPTATDQGSLGVNATQAMGSAQPTFVADCINGLPCYSFDGGDYLTTAALAVALSQPSMTVAVASPDVVAGTVTDRGAHTGDRNLLDISAGAWRGFAGSSLTGGTPVSGQWESLVVSYNGASSSVRVSGASAASGDAGAQTMPSLTIGVQRAAGTTLSGFWSGTMAEIIVYDTTPDATEVETYLECLYGTFPVAP